MKEMHDLRMMKEDEPTTGNLILGNEKGMVNNPYTIAEYEAILEEGTWGGGYVETLGNTPASENVFSNEDFGYGLLDYNGNPYPYGTLCVANAIKRVYMNTETYITLKTILREIDEITGENNSDGVALENMSNVLQHFFEYEIALPPSSDPFNSGPYPQYLGMYQTAEDNYHMVNITHFYGDGRLEYDDEQERGMQTVYTHNMNSSNMTYIYKITKTKTKNERNNP